MTRLLRDDPSTSPHPHFTPHAADDVASPAKPTSPPDTTVPPLQLHSPGLADELRDLQERERLQVEAEKQTELARLRDVARFD
jgi:hypothetical protein